MSYVGQVLQISTGHTGGAGLAPRRLNLNLRQQGYSSNFIAIERKSYTLQEFEFAFHRSFPQIALSILYMFISKLSTKNVLMTFFGVSLLNLNDLEGPGSNVKPILHFHNTFNFINLKRVKKFIDAGYKIVWTLHDQRVFTGGCHYSLQCKKFKTNCFNCPNTRLLFRFVPALVLAISSKKYRSYIEQINFVAPSNWLLNEAMSSKILKNSNIQFIPNSITVDNFNFPNREPRNRSHKIKIGIASMDPWSYIKGGEITKGLINLMKIAEANFDLIVLADLPSESKNTFWEEIDFLLAISRADNSPNVIHEAKLLGIPVIASPVGGIPELLYENVDFLLPKVEISPSELLNILNGHSEMVINHKEEVAASKIYEEYVRNNITRHIQLYEKLSQ